MGIFFSRNSPHQDRVYRDPGDLDEEIMPLRYFGKYRAGSNLVPDDIDGLPSTAMEEHLAQNADLLLYEAEFDQGFAWRCCRPIYLFLFFPAYLAVYLAIVATQGLANMCVYCSCDQICCWLRKEYSTRHYFRIYPNRIVTNYPRVRWPFGYCGCGSWNADLILAHPFDRGAFGFQTIKCGILQYLCCTWPVYGGAVARHRCSCNGPLWNRMFTDCGGWWCDEWLCACCFCTYKYNGLAYPDEVTFACSIALQAYFEGRALTREDMDKCIQYFHDNIYEVDDPEGRKRDVCCEPCSLPCCTCIGCYNCIHCNREIPYADDEITDETREVWARYKEERPKQMEHFKKSAAIHGSSLCRTCGCRRFFGRKGCCFCTEGCNCNHKNGEPAPPFDQHDFDDDYDATTVLFKVLGPPPPNVVIRRWHYDVEKGENVLMTFPTEEVEFENSPGKPKKRVASEKVEGDAVAQEEASAEPAAEHATNDSEGGGAAPKEE